MKSFPCLLFCLVPLMISSSNPKDVIEGNNKFAFKLYQKVQTGSTGSNLIYSPFSISTAMAMVYAGARGETASQIKKTIEFQHGEEFHADYQRLLDGLNEGTEHKIKLNIANGLWVQRSFKFLDSYFGIVQSNYHSELKDVDFIDNAKREIARREINVWVEQKTNDKIKNLLGPGDLTSLTRLVLVNAIYFYGDWDNPFEKSASKPYEFNLADGTKITVPFMNRQDHYKYYEDSKIQAIEITYKDNKASMVIFLPAKQIPITDFEKVFDYQYYIEVVGSFKDSDVQLAVPKFRSTFKLNLNSILSEMGMPMAFSDNADFSGMTGKRDLYISEVIHQAFINVDEKGTEAAAATAGIMKITSAPNPAELKIFVADHPFIFCIKDNSSGTILFMGKVMDPRVPE